VETLTIGRLAARQDTDSFRAIRRAGYGSSSAHRSWASLSEVRELLALRSKPGTRLEDIRARVESKIVDINDKIRTLDAIKLTLQGMAGCCEAGGALGDCPILESLDHGDSN
jgi:hypothetical protein